VFDPETTTFLESGCALIVGTVSADGEPHAGRAWGLDVLEDGAVTRLRLLLDVDDARSIEHAVEGGDIAITATSVRTLRSIQLKGRVGGPEVADPGDSARAQRYMDAFFADIVDTDGVRTPALLERFVPRGYLACTVEVHERFDQTPGPSAGLRVGGPT
jgi:hypothetical protein